MPSQLGFLCGNAVLAYCGHFGKLLKLLKPRRGSGSFGDCPPFCGTHGHVSAVPAESKCKSKGCALGESVEVSLLLEARHLSRPATDSTAVL